MPWHSRTGSSNCKSCCWNATANNSQKTGQKQRRQRQCGTIRKWTSATASVQRTETSPGCRFTTASDSKGDIMISEEEETLAWRLRHYREQASITQAEAAKVLGLDATAITK